jgi:uncharacterized protein (TIGR02246 family)
VKQCMIAAAFALAVLSPTQAAADESLRDTLQSRQDAWAAAFNASDKGALGAFYEEAAVLVPPGSPPVHGRTAIADFLSTLFTQIEDLKLVVDQVRSLGPDYAVEIGQSDYVAIGEDGSRASTVDDYQVVWHRGDDGVWRYVTDMFNSR